MAVFRPVGKHQRFFPLLPAHGLSDAGARNRVGQLRTPQVICSDAPRKVRVCHELPGRPSFARSGKSDPFAAQLAHEAQGLGYAAVVAHDHTLAAGLEPTVVQEMHGQVDIGAFLFGLDDLDRTPSTDRKCKRCSDPVTQELPKAQFRPRAGIAVPRADRHPVVAISKGLPTCPKRALQDL